MAPVSISVDTMVEKLCIHLSPFATTPALIAAITQLTVSATHVQATTHKQRVKPLQKVTMMSAVTLATITALRYRSSGSALCTVVLHSPEEPVKISAVFTSMAPVTMSRHTVQCTTQTTVNVTPVVLRF